MGECVLFSDSISYPYRSPLAKIINNYNENERTPEGQNGKKSIWYIAKDRVSALLIRMHSGCECPPIS